MISFIKLDINILNDTKIKIIRKLPEGDKLFLLWVGLLCLAMKSARPGVLEISDGLAYNDELLAGELDIDLNVVRLGLDWFEKLKMIEVLEDGEIFLINFAAHQSLEKIEKKRIQARERKRKERAKIKALSCAGLNITKKSRSSHGDVTHDTTVTHAGHNRDSHVSHADVTCESANVTQQTKTKTKTKTKTGLNYIPANPADDCGETNPEPEKIQEEVFKKTEKPKPENKADPEITEFCNNFLLAVQKKHGIQAPKKPKLSAWEDEVDKIIRLDGFTLEQIKNAVRWGMSDSFWSPNILSLAELRKKKTGSDLTKFQKLYANYSQANTSGSRRNPPVGRIGQKPSLISLCSSYLEELENEKGAGNG